MQKNDLKLSKSKSSNFFSSISIQYSWTISTLNRNQINRNILMKMKSFFVVVVEIVSIHWIWNQKEKIRFKKKKLINNNNIDETDIDWHRIFTMCMFVCLCIHLWKHLAQNERTKLYFFLKKSTKFQMWSVDLFSFHFVFVVYNRKSTTTTKLASWIWIKLFLFIIIIFVFCFPKNRKCFFCVCKK